MQLPRRARPFSCGRGDFDEGFARAAAPLHGQREEERHLLRGALDVLMVMDPSYQQQADRVARDSEQLTGAVRLASLDDHMATQKEFNTYLDYGGQLSSSRSLRPY